MQDITELERRIAAAFDRIDRGLEQADRARAAAPSAAAPTLAQTQVAPTGGQTSTLLRSLETAAASNADWAKRYAALETQLAEVTLSMGGEISKLTEDLAKAQADLQTALAKADLPAPQPSPDQETKLMELRRQLAAQSTELTQLRAQRDAEIEELKSIVAALTPLIQEAKPHA